MDNYIVSARKYRPSTFRSVVGQKSLTTTLKNAMSDSGDYSPAQLAAMLEQMDWADQALKSTGLEDRLVLEQTVVRLFLASRGGN